MNQSALSALSARNRLELRISAVVALLVLELWITVTQFDFSALRDQVDAWAWNLEIGRTTMVMSVLLALVVIVTPKAAPAWRSLSAAAATHEGAFWLPGQLAAFALFYAATSLLLSLGSLSGVSANLLALLWLATAGASGLTLLACVAPPHYWRDLLRSQVRTVLVVTLLASFICLVAHGSKLLWEPLRSATYFVVEHLLDLFFDDVVSDPGTRLIGAGSFQVTIGAPCSGMQGIGIVLAFTSGVLWMMRKELRWPRGLLLLLPVVALVIWLINALRITTLIAIGSSWSQDVAMIGFHKQAGWIGVLLVCGGVLGLVHSAALRRAPSDQASHATRATDSIAGPLLLPLICLLTATLLCGAFSAAFDWLYPLKVLATGAVLLWFWRSYEWGSMRGWPFAVLAGLCVYVLWVLIVPPAPEASLKFSTTLFAAPPWQADGWLAFRVVGAIVTVPLAEELAFRGYLLSRLSGLQPSLRESRSFGWFAILGSSLAFGALHGAWVAGTLSGLVFAGLRWRYGSVGHAVIAHGTANAALAAHVVLSGQWSYW